jgi:ATP-dependent helicase/nuclease subunit B
MAGRRIVRFGRTVDGLRVASGWLTPRVNRSETVLIGATRAATHEFARQLPVKGTLGLHRLTLIQAAEEIARSRILEQQLGPLSRLGAEALAARVVHRLYQSQKLTYFAPVAKLPGFAAALALTLSDLRLAQVLPDSLDPQDDASRELRLFLTEYERELMERRLADLPLLLSQATQCTRSGDHFLLGHPLLLLDVPLASAAHIAFLRALAREQLRFLLLSRIVTSNESVLSKSV